jgi:hypothetical protein
MYTLQGKSNQHATRISHSVRIWSQTINRVGQSHYSREKEIPDYIPSTPVDRSVGPHPVSLLLSTKEGVEKAKHLSTVGY